MKVISDYLNTAPDSIKIDWSAIEEKLGFKIREELKAFYSRRYYKTKGYANTVCGIFDVSDSVVTVPSGNERFDKWFSSSECEDADRGVFANSMDDFVKKMLELEDDYEKPHPLSVGEVVFFQD